MPEPPTTAESTPSAWIPFETILCINNNHDVHMLYVGLGTFPPRGILPGRQVQLFVDINHHHWAFAESNYMVTHYHDIRACETRLHSR
jgi:hypothetical protein